MFYYNSDPQSSSTTEFHRKTAFYNECEPWRDEQHGGDGYQTTEDLDVFEIETVPHSSDIAASN